MLGGRVVFFFFLMSDDVWKCHFLSECVPSLCGRVSDSTAPCSRTAADTEITKYQEGEGQRQRKKQHQKATSE